MPSCRKALVFSFRAIAVTIALAGILPTLAFSVVLLLRYADSERSRAERGLIESARAIAQVIDSHFIAAEAMLLALRGSTFLGVGDLAAFETRLRRTTAETGWYFALVEENGQQLINTFFDPGAPLLRNDSAPWEPIFKERRTLVTNVFRDQSTGRLFAGVGVPVISDGTVRWALVSSLFAEEFKILQDPGVPADWIVSVVDRNGVHLARSHNNDKFAGKPLVSALVEHMKKRGGGALRTVSLEGIPLISTIQYAPRSGWAAAVGLPIATLEAPVRNSVRDLIIIGGILTLAAVALAFLIARLLDRAMSGLTFAATGLRRREIVTPRLSAVQEVNAVANDLADASRELHDLTTSLETQVVARTAELSATNAKLVEEMRLRQESQAQLSQMQKIEAIGHLTGGIAHDFNNMLAIIMGSLRLLQRRLERGETDVRQYVDGAMQGAERAASLTSRLLAFSRQQPLAPVSIDANRLIASMDEMLRRTIPESVQIETVLAGGLWQAFADPQGLENAIINLAVNARDAMPDGGKLTIETGNCLLDDAYAASHHDVSAGQYVMIAVTDTGTGIPREVIARVFDPFFTTKPAGLGTGLGLSQAHGFVKQSGGHIAIYSEVGRGTTVKLYLPRLAASSEAGANRRPSAGSVPRAANGETILVVEDQQDVRRVTVDMLRELGYVPLEAEGAHEALSLLEEHPEVALLLTDVVMPHMNGRQLAEEARARRPDLAVLFTTGYTRNAIVHHGILDPHVHVIAKPHTLEMLAQKVGELLQSQGQKR